LLSDAAEAALVESLASVAVRADLVELHVPIVPPLCSPLAN
jgi:hypothetical protein